MGKIIVQAIESKQLGIFSIREILLPALRGERISDTNKSKQYRLIAVAAGLSSMLGFGPSRPAARPRTIVRNIMGHCLGDLLQK